MSDQETSSGEFLNEHGRVVHRFALDMANLGLSVVGQRLISMLESEAWREFGDGLGVYRFLPGEFDYFLTQQGIERDHVMHGVADVAVKAKLEEFMDERRTGDRDYRRPLTDVRRENPNRPGRPIMPFGYTASDARLLHEEGTVSNLRPRLALGTATRRYRLTDGATTIVPSRQLPLVERLARSAVRLPDDELDSLIQALEDERKHRQSATSASPPHH